MNRDSAMTVEDALKMVYMLAVTHYATVRTICEKCEHAAVIGITWKAVQDAEEDLKSLGDKLKQNGIY